MSERDSDSSCRPNSDREFEVFTAKPGLDFSSDEEEAFETDSEIDASGTTAKNDDKTSGIKLARDISLCCAIVVGFYALLGFTLAAFLPKLESGKYEY